MCEFTEADRATMQKILVKTTQLEQHQKDINGSIVSLQKKYNVCDNELSELKEKLHKTELDNVKRDYAQDISSVSFQSKLIGMGTALLLIIQIIKGF